MFQKNQQNLSISTNFYTTKRQTETTVNDKCKKKFKILRDSGVEAIKTTICTLKGFNLFNCALF